MSVRSVRVPTAVAPLGNGARPVAGPVPTLEDAIREKTGPARRSRLLALAAAWVVIVAIAATIFDSGKMADSVVYITILAIAAVGYDAVVGMAGQLYLGINGIVAVGAYTSGLLAVHITDQPVLGLVVGAASGVMMALFTGVIAFRLREFYFAIFTLAFGIFIEFVAIAWQDVTGGSTGLGPIPGMLGGNIVLPNYRAWIIFAGSILGLVLVFGTAVRQSRTGRIWRTIARDERLAVAFGINTTYYRFLVLAYAGALAGVAGFMMARYTQFLSPEAFGMALALQLILMVFLGGRGSVWGAIVGAAIVYGVNRYFSDRGDYGDIVLGSVFIVVLVVMPAGIAGGARQIGRFGRDLLARAGGRSR